MGHMYEGKYGPADGINKLPDGIVEVALPTPLGINFEEINPGPYPKGMTVIGVVPGGNAERSGKVQEGDDLIAVTGIKMSGAKFERQLFDCTQWDFDTCVEAIKSNTEEFKCNDVILRFRRKS